MTLSLPNQMDRTLDQRMDALAKANRIRLHRAQLKRDIHAGRKSFLAVLVSPVPDEEHMKVRDLLLAIPGVGRTKANDILRRTHTSPSKTLVGLSPRQRQEITSALRDRMKDGR